PSLPQSGVTTIAAIASVVNSIAVKPSTRACAPRQTASTKNSICGLVAPSAKCTEPYSTIACRTERLATSSRTSCHEELSTAPSDSGSALAGLSGSGTASNQTRAALSAAAPDVTAKIVLTPPAARSAAPSIGPAIVPSVLAVWIQPVTR